MSEPVSQFFADYRPSDVEFICLKQQIERLSDSALWSVDEVREVAERVHSILQRLES